MLIRLGMDMPLVAITKTRVSVYTVPRKISNGRSIIINLI